MRQSSQERIPTIFKVNVYLANGKSMFLQSVVKFIPDYTALRLRKQYFFEVKVWKEGSDTDGYINYLLSKRRKKL
jgi:hypothetical protein